MAHQFRTARPAPKKKTAPKKDAPPSSRVPVHAFERDEAIPRNFHRDAYCVCGLPGQSGDARHPFGAPPLIEPLFPPLPPEAKEIDLRILGESGDDAA
jgi:hypothetical protein